MIICKWFLQKFVFIQYLANRLHPNYSLFDALCKSFFTKHLQEEARFANAFSKYAIYIESNVFMNDNKNVNKIAKEQYNDKRN
ncbi:hypothetical protein HMPREF9087_2111 [Enterococcus casseliflavus ATCC 12755]|uniref:Uncharacterized protein n=1 Tax=Enterococcus casseliflavus ATCC 12755 TaxID=888066 RepID=F0EL19_ENTCA|nr:hypothetical protein HMPREF9087_2111 [Enterococcus casseliflavus ATCC 12755]